MKILLVTESRGWSGGAAQTLYLAKGLRAKGHDVWIACNPIGDIFQRAKTQNIPVCPVRIRGDADPFAITRIHGFVRQLGIDILHAQHPKAHAVSLLASLLLSKRLPLLVTRRVSFPVGENFFSGLKYTASRIDRFIAVSDGIRDVLIKAGVPASRVVVIYSGVDPATFRHPDAATTDRLRQALQLDPALPVVIKVANFSAWKGQDVLLQAVARLKAQGRRVQVLLAGRDTDGAEVTQRIQTLGLEGMVKGLGFRTDVAELLSLAQVSVNSATAGEGLSGALRESLALGVPCVASDISGNAELVQDGKTGRVVPPNAPDPLAGAIEWTLSHRDEALRLAEQGRQRVFNEFTVDHMVEQTEALYHALLREKAAGT